MQTSKPKPVSPTTRPVVSWNKGAFVGPKPSLKPKQVGPFASLSSAKVACATWRHSTSLSTASCAVVAPSSSLDALQFRNGRVCADVGRADQRHGGGRSGDVGLKPDFTGCRVPNGRATRLRR